MHGCGDNRCWGCPLLWKFRWKQIEDEHIHRCGKDDAAASDISTPRSIRMIYRWTNDRWATFDIRTKPSDVSSTIDRSTRMNIQVDHRHLSVWIIADASSFSPRVLWRHASFACRIKWNGRACRPMASLPWIVQACWWWLPPLCHIWWATHSIPLFCPTIWRNKCASWSSNIAKWDESETIVSINEGSFV